MAVGADALYVAFMGTKQGRDLVTDANILHEPVWAEAAALAADHQVRRCTLHIAWIATSWQVPCTRAPHSQWQACALCVPTCQQLNVACTQIVMLAPASHRCRANSCLLLYVCLMQSIPAAHRGFLQRARAIPVSAWWRGSTCYHTQLFEIPPE